MNNDILNNMETISNKLNFYKKKFNTMGWDSEELKAFYALGLEYVQLECQLFDHTFKIYILEDLLNNSIITKLKYLKKKIGWKFNTLINRDDIINIQSQFDELKENEKKKIIAIIIKLQLELEQEWDNYSENNLENWEDISLLLSHDTSNKKDVINDYIIKKFSLLINILGGDHYYESIKKSGEQY